MSIEDEVKSHVLRIQAEEAVRNRPTQKSPDQLDRERLKQLQEEEKQAVINFIKRHRFVELVEEVAAEIRRQTGWRGFVPEFSEFHGYLIKEGPIGSRLYQYNANYDFYDNSKSLGAYGTFVIYRKTEPTLDCGFNMKSQWVGEDIFENTKNLEPIVVAHMMDLDWYRTSPSSSSYNPHPV